LVGASAQKNVELVSLVRAVRQVFDQLLPGGQFRPFGFFLCDQKGCARCQKE
jgi:hypothetical protein